MLLGLLALVAAFLPLPLHPLQDDLLLLRVLLLGDLLQLVVGPIVLQWRGRPGEDRGLTCGGKLRQWGNSLKNSEMSH